jgi:hypothetical protein
MDSGQEVPRGLIITSGDGTELLELAEEVFNPMACFVPFAIVCTLVFTVRLGRNHRDFPGLRQGLEHSLVGIVAFISNHDRRVERRQQDIGSVQVTGLTGRQQKAGRVAEGIDGGMDFGAQPAFAASNGLVFTLFF